jgi:hypothetical protein
MNPPLEYKMRIPIQQTTHDEIYETIVGRMIWVKPSSSQEPKTTPSTPTFDIINPQISPDLSKKIEELKLWQDLYGKVSPETYTARILLYRNAKRPIPMFLSKNTFRIKHLMEEITNRFISPKIREELIHHFCKFKRTYWAFTLLARIWKVRKTPVRIQTDLYMNELDWSEPTTYLLVHPDGIYLFSLQNIARIIVDAITHQSGMFVAPLPIKNPYTNNLLFKCDLFNIYLSLRYYHIRIHEMLERFYRCEFNIFEFQRKYETELRDYAIEQYAKTASTSELAQDIDDMLRLHRTKHRIVISPGFPQKNLVDTMRPFLKTYLLKRYSFSSTTRKYSAKKLEQDLRQFAEKNPLYGRRNDDISHNNANRNPFAHFRQRIDETPPQLQESHYITNTKPYPNYCASNYMRTHIYNEETFDRYIDTGDTIETYTESESPFVDESLETPEVNINLDIFPYYNYLDIITLGVSRINNIRQPIINANNTNTNTNTNIQSAGNQEDQDDQGDQDDQDDQEDQDDQDDQEDQDDQDDQDDQEDMDIEVNNDDIDEDDDSLLTPLSSWADEEDDDSVL